MRGAPLPRVNRHKRPAAERAVFSPLSCSNFWHGFTELFGSTVVLAEKPRSVQATISYNV